MAVNVAKLVNMRSDEDLRRDVVESDLITADGSGVTLGCRLLGLGQVERVTGIDLMENILALCATKGYKPYVLGAKQDILEKAANNIKARYPKLEFAGLRNGYYKREEEAAVVADIARSGADCLFIAISSPHKERLMRTYKDTLNVPFLMGVGGSIDVMAGFVNRAPKWVQKIGMEWFYRMAQEPRRLFFRYFSTNGRFALLLLQAYKRKIIGG